ncbi:hypothetical protein SNL152K_9011 [Streptomyces sp. NL15-2K]|nr:hypothetical protein SNL152K_9011 [Streptomyces sp. NL15-2K]
MSVQESARSPYRLERTVRENPEFYSSPANSATSCAVCSPA